MEALLFYANTGGHGKDVDLQGRGRGVMTPAAHKALGRLIAFKERRHQVGLRRLRGQYAIENEEPNRLIALKEHRHQLEIQRLREKLAQNLGRKRFLNTQQMYLFAQLREQDEREARP